MPIVSLISRMDSFIPEATALVAGSDGRGVMSAAGLSVSRPATRRETDETVRGQGHLNLS